jgi:RHS repeat-associated protein
MKKQIPLLIGVIILTLNSITIHAQDDNRKADNGPDFDTWSEERIKQWEDSIRNILYPPLEIRTAPKPPDTPKEEDKGRGGQNNTYVPNSVTVDLTRAVGEIPMTSAVSPAGAVTYNVPVEVYPGVRGIQPQLSIAYNNQAGNGILGAGWNISGLSSVNRGNRSMYYDGKSQGVVMSKDDAFYLDGTRLIKISETTAEIKYESEQGNIKATAFLNGAVVKYFNVFYPNGTKGTYGHTSNSSTNYLEFPVTSFSDLYGNTITYLYTYIDNHYRIGRISYASASVEFQYASTSRTDVITYYFGGLKVRNDKLLQKIVCKYGNAVLRNYEFTYTFQKETSLLTKIDYSAANGSSFNPLQFYYGENNTATEYNDAETQLLEWYAWTNKDQIRVNKGKFDYGKENDGLIVLPNKNPYWQHYRGSSLFQHSQNRFDNYYAGTEKIFLYTGLNSSFASPMPNLTTETGYIDILCANVDGKREEEVVKVNNTVSGSNDQIVFKTYTANVYNGLGLKHTRTFNFPTVLTDADGGKSVHPKFYFTGDFNGDGKIEILAVSCHNPFGWTDKPTKCYLFDLETNTKLYDGQPFAYNVTFVGTLQTNPDIAAQNTDRLFVFDYDGDGKSDLCLINSLGTYIYTFNVSGSTYSMQQIAYYSGLKRADLDGRLLMIGEFNGDGKPDFLLSPKLNASDWYIYYATGTGQFEKVQVSIYPRYSTYSYLLQDANTDGLTDVIEYTSSCFYTYRARNGGFSSYESYKPFAYSNSYFIPTDINSAPSHSQLIALKDGKVRRYSYPRNDTKEKLLTGSVTSFGVVNKNYYGRLNESSGFHTQGYGAVYPFENFQGSLYVPVYREQYFNGQRNENLYYWYENAVIHKQGLGFRGFEKITTYDNIRGRSAYRKYDPYKYCELKEEDSPVAKNTYTYSHDVAANKIAKVRLTNRSSQDKLKNITVTSAYTYDTYGNPLTETVNYGGGISATVSNVVYYNNTNETSYLLGFLTDRTKTTNRNGAAWSERFQVSAHDSKGQPNTVVIYSNGNQVSQETFDYDAKGNNISHGVKSYTSTATFTTGYAYNSYGRMTGQTDPLGFNTAYVYNSSNGSLYQVKNHKNQATTYTYDEFWRVSRTDYFTGAIATSSFYWTNYRGANTLYCNYRHHYGSPWTKNYYDALGRETSSTALTRGLIETGPDKMYDSYGRLWKVSLPYFDGSSATHWNTCQYDSNDRPASVSEASGRNTTYSYNGNSITTTRDGITSTQTFDTQGNLTQVADPAGTITYNLRPDGQPSSIVAPGSITTSFTYDGYGRQLTIVDPSAGTQTFTYDAAGNVATEKDANNKTIIYGYDTYNRLTTKTYPEFTARYRYNSDGLLASDSINSTLFIAYTYDMYGRLETEKQTVASGRWLQREYGYWGNGNTGWTRYRLPDGSILTEMYSNPDEGLLKITVDGTDIWELNTTNSFRQATSIKTGNINRSYSYNVYGLPTGRTAGSFQNHTYAFDATKGNLTSRKDNIKNIQENFAYDNLNRLTGFAGKTAVYNLNGNINSLSDVGTFQYNTPGKPYTISGVTSPASAIPMRNQTVTYTSFKRPATIAEGQFTAAFTYNGSGNRVKMELKKNGAKELDRYYLFDCYEIDDRAVGGVKEKLYLGGDFYTAPAVYVKEGNGSWQIYYICRDYLGSITHVTNSSGTVVQELSYDAWGKLRNPANQAVYAPDSEPTLFLGRGYTGHEHLTQFGLINMNARLYDAAVGRFLSPDPYVQNPLFSQSYNRYSYALNNPLIYTDPTGEFFFSLLLPGIGTVLDAACWGAVFSGGLYTVSVALSPGGFNNWSWKDFGYSCLNGAINGALSSVNPFSWSLGGGFSIGLQPNLMISSNGMGFGATLGLDYNITKWMSAGLDIGFQHYFMTTGTEKYNESAFMLGYGLEFGNKKNNVSLYSNYFAATDGSSQRVGGIGMNFGKFNMRYENDGAPFYQILGPGLNDGKDRLRTAAAQIGWGDWNLRLLMMTGTGSGPHDANEVVGQSSKYPHGYYKGGNVDNIRLGALSLGYGNFRVGVNSEGVRHVFQNRFAHDSFFNRQPGYKILDNNWYPYYYWGTTNRYYLW